MTWNVPSRRKKIRGAGKPFPSDNANGVEQRTPIAAMKAALGAFIAFLLGSAICIQPAQAQVQIQLGPVFSFQIGPGAPPPPEPPREGWREREGFYGGGWEERRDERWRARERERCRWVANPTERHECFDRLR